MINAQQAAELTEAHVRTGKPIRNLIIDVGFLDEDALLSLLAGYMGCDLVDLTTIDIPPHVRSAVPAAVARMYNVVPIDVQPGSVTLATSGLVDPLATDELMFVLARDITFVLAREVDVMHRVNEYYGDDSTTVAEMLSTVIEEDESLGLGDETEDEKAIAEQAGAAPVVRYVNLVLYQAVKDRASDIHFEPFEKEFRIRYRIDGALYEMQPPPRRLALPIISRVKVLANLNIAERRLPQDGRIAMTVAGHQVDLRVSCLPTQFGESVVLRVLDRSNVSLDMHNLGIPEDVLDSLMMDIEKPNGIIIVTYQPDRARPPRSTPASIRSIPSIPSCSRPRSLSSTIWTGSSRCRSTLVGNTFARALRAFLRQDPDILMVGEIRDLETAEIAIQASLTGHLVFSTLHTNDAAGAVTRLIDMDVAPYLVSSTLEGVLAQRLVRTICSNCKTPYVPDDETLQRLSMRREQIGDRPFYYGRGCSQCNNSGYKGRKGIFEYLRISEPIRQLINDRQPTLIIREKARELGMRTIREDGVRNVLDGYTTVDEILRYT